jgi:hypothetical protein
MADPFRLRVLKALTARLKTITVANGYQHDLADFDDAGLTKQRVFRGRDQFGAGDPQPMLSILEHPRALEGLLGTSGNPSSSGEWELLIQGFAEDDRLNPTDPAHLLAADVVKCLSIEAQDIYNLLGLGDRQPCVTEIRIGQPVVRPADGEISDVAFFFLSVTLKLVEDRSNPFA